MTTYELHEMAMSKVNELGLNELRKRTLNDVSDSMGVR